MRSVSEPPWSATRHGGAPHGGGRGGGSDDGRDGPPAVPHGLDYATRTVITVGSSLAGELVHGWIAPDRLLTDVTTIAAALTSTVLRARIAAGVAR